MTPLRFSMLTATLLAFAATVHGQTLPEPTTNCPAMSTWFAPYLQQGMQTWQQVRGFCTGHTCASGVCGSVAVGAPGCCKAGSCAVGSVKTVQAADSCCCAKARACCESCKTKKTEADLAKFDDLFIFGGLVWRRTLPSSVHLPPSPPIGPIGIALPQTYANPQPSCVYGPPMYMPSPNGAPTGSLMLGAGVNCDNGVVGHLVLNERNFDIKQAERDLKIAEFYQRTGHPGAAQFYYELVMRRHGPVLPPMPAPYQTVQVHAIPMPCPGPVAIALPYGNPHAPSMPVPPPPPMAGQIVHIHAIPAPPMIVPPPSYGYQSAGTLTPDLNLPCCNSTFAVTQPQFGGFHPGANIPVADCAAAPAVKHVHLVTPDLEAHAARMTQRGDTIILEEDVILLNKKYPQPMRIEAQRAIINMKDGSVTVEGSTTISNFGVTRTSAVAPAKEASKAAEQSFRAVRLRHAQANDVAAMIAGQLANGRSFDDVTVQAEPISNSILVIAPPQAFELLVQMVAELDRAPQLRPIQPNTVVLHLKHIDATQVALTLQRRLLGAQRKLRGDGSARVHDIRIAVDDHTNSIIIAGATEDIELVRGIVAELDQPMPTTLRSEMRVLPGR